MINETDIDLVMSLVGELLEEATDIQRRVIAYRIRRVAAKYAADGNPASADPVEIITNEDNAKLNRPIAELNLSVRARHALRRQGIATIAELVQETEDDLLEFRNLGSVALHEIKEKLSAHGLKLRG